MVDWSWWYIKKLESTQAAIFFQNRKTSVFDYINEIWLFHSQIHEFNYLVKFYVVELSLHLVIIYHCLNSCNSSQWYSVVTSDLALLFLKGYGSKTLPCSLFIFFVIYYLLTWQYNLHNISMVTHITKEFSPYMCTVIIFIT